MRDAFDARFALAVAPDTTERLDVLAITVAGQPFALRMSEVAGVAAGRRIVALPGSHALLLGLIGVRGALVPVYSLAALLGLPSTRDLRWVAMRGTNPGVAFAFDALDAYARVAASDIHPDRAPRPLLRGVVRIGAVQRPLLHLPTAEESATRETRPPPVAPSKEI